MKYPLLLFSRIRLLALLSLCAVLLLGVKAADVWYGVTEYRAIVSVAQAEPAPPPAIPPAEAAAKPAAASVPPGSDLSVMSESEVALLQRLAERRETLDQRDRQLETRENLLTAAEKRVAERIVKLTEIETNVSKLIDQFDAQEEARIKKLVQVYQSMKPKDAAAIFNQLDMDVLQKVAKRMDEAKFAEVLGNMTADAAKKLTVEMAKQKKLPEISG